MKQLLILLFFPLQLAFGQQQTSLDSCYNWTRQNYPNLKNAGIWEQISALEKKNIKTAYLPQLTLNGQATYQSDVTSLDISLPSSLASQISLPSMSKDQYKAYAELKQTLWDGGVSVAQSKLEDAILQNNLSQLEVELYKLKEQVAQFFFTILAINKQVLVLDAQKKILQSKLKLIQSGIENGAMEKASAYTIEAEIINLDQNKTQLLSGKDAATKMLSILTGKNLTNNNEFSYTPDNVATNQIIQRPETELFASQRSQLETQSKLLQKTRNPKFFGFGQAGYGRPGLNMLDDNFNSYYRIGIGVSWNAFDWKKTSRQKEMLRYQSQMVSHQEATFNQNINLLLARQKTEIEKLNELIKSDAKMVTLRINIAQISASKLENETITTSDYVEDVQAETIAKLNTELHRIQLNEAKEKYRIIQGNKVDNGQ